MGHSFIHLFNHLFIYSFIQSFIYSIIHSFIHSIIHSIIHSFIYYVRSSPLLSNNKWGLGGSFIHSFIIFHVSSIYQYYLSIYQSILLVYCIYAYSLLFVFFKLWLSCMLHAKKAFNHMKYLVVIGFVNPRWRSQGTLRATLSFASLSVVQSCQLYKHI